jgi:hypothetical protein
VFSEVAEIALVAARLGQFQQLLKTRVILILNFTRPHAITYINNRNEFPPRKDGILVHVLPRSGYVEAPLLLPQNLYGRKDGWTLARTATS